MVATPIFICILYYDNLFVNVNIYTSTYNVFKRVQFGHEKNNTNITMTKRSSSIRNRKWVSLLNVHILTHLRSVNILLHATHHMEPRRSLDFTHVTVLVGTGFRRP